MWHIGDPRLSYVHAYEQNAAVYDALESASEIEITYETSPDPGEAGPKGDMFLMPAATIGILKTLLVRMSVSSDAKTCTIHASEDKSWEILLYLSGFYFIQVPAVCPARVFLAFAPPRPRHGAARKRV